MSRGRPEWAEGGSVRDVKQRVFAIFPTETQIPRWPWGTLFGDLPCLRTEGGRFMDEATAQSGGDHLVRFASPSAAPPAESLENPFR